MKRTLAMISLTCAVSACSAPPPDTMDAGSDAGRDVAVDAPLLSTPSGVTATMCTAAMDLNAAGTTMGTTVTTRGSTQMPTELMVSPCNPSVSGHQVFRYRVRGDNVSIRATTNLPGGTDYLDTVLWALDGSCSESARVLACNDDDPAADMGRAGTSTILLGSMARGTEIAFVVAAYSNVRRGAVTRGDFTLGVIETPSATAGNDCDSSIPGGCVRPLECAATSPTRGLCVQTTNETEPNNTPAMAGAPRRIDRSLAIHAAIDPAGDIDCFAFAVPDQASLFVEASDGGGACPAELHLDLYRPGDTVPFDGDEDGGRATSVACPRMAAVDHASLRHMAAGTYTFCLHVAEPSDRPPMVRVQQYSLHVAVVPM